MKVRNKNGGIYTTIFYGGGIPLSGGFYPHLMGKIMKQANKLPRTMKRIAERAKAGVKEGRTPLVAVIGQMLVEKVAERARKKRRK